MMFVFYRIYQFILKLASSFLPWREPQVLRGENSLSALKDVLINSHLTTWMIVTDPGIVSAGLLEHLKKTLDDPAYRFVVYDQTKPNPTINNVEDAFKLYQYEQCQGIIALGGGSSIDAAKGLAIKVKYPFRKLSSFKGILKVFRKLPLLIAIPTTAGTGSECTLAAVISNDETHEKYAIMDPHLIPTWAVLDPVLIKNLPPFYTATTGMDALTHAIEAYVSKGRTKKTMMRSLSAMDIIFNHLVLSYKNPSDLNQRSLLLQASYDAGYAFTRAYVGNIHAISHTFSGFYNVPHGYANAIIMPHVLRYSFEYIKKDLATVYRLLQLGNIKDSIDQQALAIIELIESMNQKMGIPKNITIDHQNHLETMIERAYQEANPLYPVPHIFTKHDFRQLFQEIIKLK